MKNKRHVMCRSDRSEEGFSYAVAMPKEYDFLYEKVGPELMRQHFDNAIASAIADLATGWDRRFIGINEATIRIKFERLPHYKEAFFELFQKNKNQKTRR